MNAILNRVQTDWTKFQKSLEKESEVLLDKIVTAANKAANNERVVEKRRNIEKMVESQYKKFEPTLDRIYKDLKGTAEKYGVNVQKIEKGVIATTQSAARRFNLSFAPAGASFETAPPAAPSHEDGEEVETPASKKKQGRKKGSKKA
jgi:hypothetical protein